MSAEALNTKARDLMAPVLGAQRTDTLIERMNAVEKVGDMRDITPLLTA